MSRDTLDGSAIREIERLTSTALDPIYPTGEARGVYYLRDGDGNLERHEAQRDRHHTTAYDLRSVKDIIKGETVSDLDAVYVTDRAVIVHSSDARTTWRTTLNLPTHPAFAHLLKWRNLTALTQKELVRLLRTELREHVDPTIISTFTSLKFTNNSEGTSTIRPTSSALDTSIRQQVATAQGADAPETITFHVPVYDIPEARGDQFDVTVYVEYDHDERRFLLLAVHSDLRKAQEDAVANLIDDLTLHADGAHPVLYGEPITK